MATTRDSKESSDSGGRYTLRVHRMLPWKEYNDYEGQIEGELNGFPVCCYVFVTSSAEWSRYPAGTVLPVDAWVERTGRVELVDGTTPMEFVQVRGEEYDVTGTIVDLDGENCHLASSLRIRVDLDVSARSRGELPPLSVGDRVRVRGSLKVDIYPDRA